MKGFALKGREIYHYSISYIFLLFGTLNLAPLQGASPRTMGSQG